MTHEQLSESREEKETGRVGSGAMRT